MNHLPPNWPLGILPTEDITFIFSTTDSIINGVAAMGEGKEVKMGPSINNTLIIEMD